MKFDFPKLTRELPLSEYAPEMSGVIQVWVNPPNKLLTDLAEAFKVYMDSKGQEGQDVFLSLLSEILSQGAEDTRWTPEELKELYNRSSDTDPAFWFWFQDQILQRIGEHRAGQKKV